MPDEVQSKWYATLIVCVETSHAERSLRIHTWCICVEPVELYLTYKYVRCLSTRGGVC